MRIANESSIKCKRITSHNSQPNEVMTSPKATHKNWKRRRISNAREREKNKSIKFQEIQLKLL